MLEEIVTEHTGYNLKREVEEREEEGESRNARQKSLQTSGWVDLPGFTEPLCLSPPSEFRGLGA